MIELNKSESEIKSASDTSLNVCVIIFWTDIELNNLEFSQTTTISDFLEVEFSFNSNETFILILVITFEHVGRCNNCPLIVIDILVE
jgi:hypothetical protein